MEERGYFRVFRQLGKGKREGGKAVFNEIIPLHLFRPKEGILYIDGKTELVDKFLFFRKEIPAKPVNPLYVLRRISELPGKHLGIKA